MSVSSWLVSVPDSEKLAFLDAQVDCEVRVLGIFSGVIAIAVYHLGGIGSWKKDNGTGGLGTGTSDYTRRKSNSATATHDPTAEQNLLGW